LQMVCSIYNLDARESGESELLSGLRCGCQEAYEELITRFQQPVFSLAYRLVSDPSDAADVVQEVFLKIFRGVARFRGHCSLKTWIYRITVNEAHNHRRWRLRHKDREVGLDDQTVWTRERGELPGDSPYNYVFGRERRALLEAALCRINPAFRQVVVLRDIAGLSYEEIAEILQMSLGTVKSRILRGREALKEELETAGQRETVLEWRAQTG